MPRTSQISLDSTKGTVFTVFSCGSSNTNVLGMENIMKKQKIKKVSEEIVELPEVHSIGVIGDPGCEGLGTYNMKVYAAALEECAKDDITLIAGDLVPEGSKYYYQTVKELTETLAENDVYVLRGNHDTGAYEGYFGRKNYALLTESFAVIVLDNAVRSFEQEGLDLLSRVLSMEKVQQVVIAFHIPVPNHFIKNSVSQEEFERLKQVYQPYKEKVKYLLCGHVHSRFEDVVDGIPLICTGGGGAMIEDVSKDIKASDVEHHVVHFYQENNDLKYRFTNLKEDGYCRERDNEILRERLMEAVQGELMAHLKYMMFADRARRRGMLKIANLFDALAASEYHHARNFYSVLENPGNFLQGAKEFAPGEKFEYDYLYRIMEEYAKEQNSPLSKQAFAAASAAEQQHERLLAAASNMGTFSEEKIYVCPICGYIMSGREINEVPERCPVCGGPARQYEEFIAENEE